MKVSKITGKYIYDKLSALYAELEDLGDACDAVSDEVGQESVAYRILNESYGEKKAEITAVENTEYTQ